MSIELLEKLSNAAGISSFEQEIVTIMEEAVQELPVQTYRDGLGSFISCTKEYCSGPKIMVAGHMDEVGFIVKEIDEHGYLRLQPVGSLWTHLLLDHSFDVICDNQARIEGLIGSVAQHGISAKVRNTTLAMKDLYLDLGLYTREEVEKLGIHIGNQVVPSTRFHRLNREDIYVGKAMDNRLGCYIALEVLRNCQSISHPKYYAVGNVQEEPGLRGARTATEVIQPDLAFAVDTTTAGDTPLNYNTVKLGQGLVISLIDSNTIAHRGLIRYMEETCRKYGIPYQYAVFKAGGTDAGNIHKTRQGIISMCLSIPVRYMHASQTIVSYQDVQACIDLLTKVVEEMNDELLEKIAKGGY
ncbi:MULTISPECIES: M42 family metallopeptidase [Terrabacteria group]|uniref:M42 family metallopeptidase n=1 Tax=Bacillati TaxID=1783272 RepID=UPI001C6F2778|nr:MULTISPECIES: M42 family metallopeptidase [Terrabacteria group]MBW9212891.1 M42 family metallopeptidase [Trueperella sp. zg.1013]